MPPLSRDILEEIGNLPDPPPENSENLAHQTDADLIQPIQPIKKQPDLNFNKEKPLIPNPNFPPKE